MAALLAPRPPLVAQDAVALNVRGQLMATTVDAGQGVSFAVTITNTSDHPITAVVDDVPLRLSHESLVAIIELCTRLRPDDALCDLAANIDRYLLDAGISKEAIARARRDVR